MAQTVWSIDGPDDVALEVQGRKYATGDSGEAIPLRSANQTSETHNKARPCFVPSFVGIWADMFIFHLAVWAETRALKPKCNILVRA